MTVNIASDGLISSMMHIKSYIHSFNLVDVKELIEEPNMSQFHF